MKDLLKNQSGQINLLGIIGIGVSIAIASIGGFMANSYRNDAKIDVVNITVNASKNDITKLQTESTQYQKDIENINKKLDTILMKLK